MPSVFEGTDQQKRKIKTLEKISTLTSSLLIYPVASRHFSPTRKKNRTTKEVLIIVVDEDGDEVKTPLQQVSIFFLRRKKKTFPILNASTVERRAISPTNILEKKTRSQKTSDSFNNLCIDGLTWTVTLSPFEKKSVLALLDSGSEVDANKLARQIKWQKRI